MAQKYLFIAILCQFHQHFTHNFFTDILTPKNFKANITREKLLNLLSYEKHARNMLMTLTPGLFKQDKFIFVCLQLYNVPCKP